jgi:D-amino-acid dehydrogenase
LIPKDDILIIGGGVIGMACAHYLAKAGRQVRLIERETVGAGASSGNCGLIVVSNLIPLCSPGAVSGELRRLFKRNSPLYIRPTTDPKRLLWLLKFARHCNPRHLKRAMRARESILHASDRLYRALIGEEKLACEWETRGVLIVCRSESKMAAYGADNEMLKPFGLEARPYAGKALHQLEPALQDSLSGAWHHETDHHLRPDLLLQEWKKNMLQRGIAIEENCRLVALRHDRGRVTAADTEKGRYRAEYYVVTAGAWTPGLLRTMKVNLPIQPGKGYSITMGRPVICPRIPCILSERKVVATPWADGYRLGGTMEFSGLNDIVVEHRLENLKSAARQYLKEPIGEPLQAEWAGVRPMVYDDLPVIDRVSGKQNLFVAAGHGMVGLTMAPATGRLVMEMICGRSPHIDPGPYGLRRFGCQ